MPIYRGNTFPSEMYKGTQLIQSVYRGDSVVYQRGVPAPTYRYLLITGYGEYDTGQGTPTQSSTRMLEVEMFSGGINRLMGLVGVSQAVHFGTNVGSTAPTLVTDGLKANANPYHGWWSDPAINNLGNAWVRFDMGQSYPIERIRYWCFASGVPRYARFKILGTNNVADFATYQQNGATGNATVIWDESTNQTRLPVGQTVGNNYMENNPIIPTHNGIFNLSRFVMGRQFDGQYMPTNMVVEGNDISIIHTNNALISERITLFPNMTYRVHSGATVPLTQKYLYVYNAITNTELTVTAPVNNSGRYSCEFTTNANTDWIVSLYNNYTANQMQTVKYLQPVLDQKGREGLDDMGDMPEQLPAIEEEI